MAQLLSVNSGLVAGLSGRRWGRKLDSADRPNVAPEEFKRQENKQAFWSQRAHSLSLTLFLSFIPSLPLPLYLSSLVSPLLTSIFLSSSKNLSLCLSSLHFFFYLICKSRTERQTSIKKRQTHHLTSQGADRQTDTEKHRQGPPYSTNILSWCRAEEHDMENVTPSLVFKKKKNRDSEKLSPPNIFCCHEHARCFIFTPLLGVLGSVFLCMQMGRCQKASPFTVLLLRVRADHSGCGSATICPLRPVFHFQNKLDFLR